MNTVAYQPHAPIEAHKVPDDARIHTLPLHFGQHMLTVENAVYRWMRRLAPAYSGGYWHFYELSNGGFYMAPECEPLLIRVEGNGYEGLMSSAAAGITACLFSFSHLSFRIDDQVISTHFHQLRDFALEHQEAGAILAAID